MTNPVDRLTVDAATMRAYEARALALEQRHFTITHGAVCCRHCPERFGMACSLAVTAGHLAHVHHITDLEAIPS